LIDSSNEEKQPSEASKVPSAFQADRGDAVKHLGEQLSDPCLKSSTRLVILISLALNKKLGFVDLLNLTGMGKGSLSNHLEKLEAAEYVKTGTTMTFGRSRVTIEITEKGAKAYNKLMKTLVKIPVEE
jgi:DNA-binding MarR family transcriptional regulator